MGRLWRESTVAVGPRVTTRYELQRHVPRPTTAGEHPTQRPLHPHASQRAADQALPATRIAPRRMPQRSGPREFHRASPFCATPPKYRARAALTSHAPRYRGTRCPNVAAAGVRSVRRTRAARSRHGARAPTGPSRDRDARAGARPAPRRLCGSINARKFSKPSAVTRPAATSSHSASSTSLEGRASIAREFVEERSASRLKGGQALPAPDGITIPQVAAVEMRAASQRPREGRARAARRA